MSGTENQLPRPEGSEDERHDDAVPTAGYSKLPMVGIGGSAGAIRALQRFFEQVPAETPFAFVVVLHLSPDHESSLPAVLQASARVPVQVAENGQKVEAGRVYVIPPGKDLRASDGHLRLEENAHPRGRRVAVDLFFRTLAESHGPHAVAVVLSGADSDGALGLARVKERGGLTVAQQPEQAEFSGMPSAAIATRMVDWVLPVEQIPKRLEDFFQREHRLKLPAESGPPLAAEPSAPPVDEESALRAVLAQVRSTTGRDFSGYKRPTLLRRIARRMQLNSTDTLEAYLHFMRNHAGEAGALVHDLLISVTNFFRDRDAWSELESVLPALFRGKSIADCIRVWVPGCATGEEAYSLGILLFEQARKHDRPPQIQIFATDLAEEAIAVAREGLYPDTIVADVADDRLRRYFVKERDGYRVRRDLREATLFAVHDILSDSPFSRIDLLSCRNVLIYLSRETQARALEIFHFALRPEGKLFLGSSESTDEDSLLFSPLNKRHRIYLRKPGSRAALLSPQQGAGAQALQRAIREAPAPSGNRSGLPPGAATERAASWAEAHLRLLDTLSAPSALVDRRNEVVHLSPSAGQFLHMGGGEPSNNLFALIHPALRLEARAVLAAAAEKGQMVTAGPVAMPTPDGIMAVTLRALPSPLSNPGIFLLSFERGEATAEMAETALHSHPEEIVLQLERELETAQRELHDIVQRYEASIEELKAGNEELQSMNEELRSASEEMESGREEMQSINEELTTVNHELKTKVDELARTNSDLQNFMAATPIATVFVDLELHITRYTPSAVALFNLIPTDIGRPLTDLKDRMDYPQMEQDARQPIEQQTTVQREVQINGLWFLASIRPYRHVDEHVGGVVFTFVDISDRKRGEDSMRVAGEVLERRVAERTAALDDANKALGKETRERRRSEGARQVMALQLLEAQEHERSRISRGLHDEVGQHLTAVLLGLKAVQGALHDHPAATNIPSLRDLVETVGRKIHDLAVELRPTALDDLGLVQALSNYLSEWSEQSGIEIDFHHSGFGGPRLPLMVESTVYRIVAEALNNVAKHSGAGRAAVVLDCTPAQVSVVVEDDGRGFAASGPELRGSHAQLGISGMMERAALLGGNVRIESSSQAGTTVYIRIPLGGGQANEA